LAGVVPFGEVLFDVAGDAVERVRQRQNQEEDCVAIQEAVRAGVEEIRAEVRAVVHEVCAGHADTVREPLAAYLLQIPSLIRQTLRRPADPSGLTVPNTLILNRPEDLLPFLPARLPRFRPGDRPPGVGDWELVELLGVGGFGEVWKARHCYFDGIAPVALKFCLDPAAKDRLLKYEASVLNQVMRQGRHPGVVALLDAYLSSDPPCLKYEYVEGGDLAGLVREWQPLPLEQRWRPATRVIERLAGIVGAAHRLQPPVVHRDLKPANVLVQRPADGDYTLRVTDFGIGGVAALPALRESRQGTTARGDAVATILRGAHTPLYASPQQRRGDPADVRDDVHALGVIWYQLLTGDLGSGAPAGLWAEELEEAGVSRDLIRLVGACVAAKAERRPHDAAELAEQLAVFLTPTEPASPGPPPAVDPAEALLKSLAVTSSSWFLDLMNRQIGDAGAQALAAWPALAKRSRLHLEGNQISDAGIKALAASPCLANVTHLFLFNNCIGDEGARALAESPYLANLSELNLGHNRIGDAGVIALANAPTLANLSALILVSNLIGDAGAQALAASPYLANLAELKPLDNRISAAGVSVLRERFGKRVRIY
jgi:serine/threonine protein kinase